MEKFVCWALSVLVAVGQERVNPDAAIIQDFQNRVAGYMKLHEAVKAELGKLKTTGSPEVIERHEHQFAHKIREARRAAAQGAIFTPAITAEFRRLIGIAMKGPDATHVQQSLKHAEPNRLKLRVNHSYPEGVPLQSMPPTLLLNLPTLPKDLEYRIAGHDLVLRDATGNVIIDLIPNAIP
jgi:hypothetical protein